MPWRIVIEYRIHTDFFLPTNETFVLIMALESSPRPLIRPCITPSDSVTDWLDFHECVQAVEQVIGYILIQLKV